VLTSRRAEKGGKETGETVRKGRFFILFREKKGDVAPSSDSPTEREESGK